MLASWPRLSRWTGSGWLSHWPPSWPPLRAPSPCSGWPCRPANGFPWSLPGWPNAVSGLLPGGAAAGAGLQFEMLSNAGFDTDAAAGALTAFSLLEVGALLALPVVAVPAALAGTAVSPGLVHTALLGLGMFCLLAIVGTVLLKTDRPLAAIGRAAQALRTGSPAAAARR